VRSFLWVLLLAAPAAAEWPRLVIYEKGTRVDRPESHPLRAFTEYPWRTLSGDICYPCSPENLAWARAQKARTDLRSIGTVNGFPVYDLFYYWHEEPRPGMKSILVQTGVDTYREIYHDEPNEGDPLPSFLVSAGSDTLLCLKDNVYRSDVEDDCFWFGKDGVVMLDFTPVWQAAQRTIPDGKRIWAHDVMARVTIPQLAIPVWLQVPQGLHPPCCGPGVVYVRFRLELGRIVVTQTDYDPDADYMPTVYKVKDGR